MNPLIKTTEDAIIGTWMVDKNRRKFNVIMRFSFTSLTSEVETLRYYQPLFASNHFLS